MRIAARTTSEGGLAVKATTVIDSMTASTFLPIEATTTVSTAPRIQRVEHRVRWVPPGASTQEDISGELVSIDWESSLRSPSNAAQIEVARPISPEDRAINAWMFVEDAKTANYAPLVFGYASEVQARHDDVETTRWGIVDGGDRLRQTKTGFSVSYKSGKTIKQVIQELATAAGWTGSFLMFGLSDEVIRKVEVVDDWISLAQSLARLGGKVIRIEGSNISKSQTTRVLRAVNDSPSRLMTEPVDLILNSSNVIYSITGQRLDVSFGRPDYGVGSLTATASVSDTRGCVSTETPQTVTTEGHASEVASVNFSQSPIDGTVTEQTPLFVPNLDKVLTLEESFVTTECDDVIRVLSRKWSYHFTEHARYKVDIDNVVNGWFGVWLEEDSPEASGYASRSEQWGVESENEELRFFDGQGFLIRIEKIERRKQFIEKALLERGSTSDPWETANAPSAFGATKGDGTPIHEGSWDDGEGLRLDTSDREQFMVVKKEITTIDVHHGTGKKISETTDVFEWSKKPGSLFKFRDGEESGAEREFFERTSRVVTSYVPINSENHLVRESHEDGPTITRTIAGGLPDAEKKTDPSTRFLEVSRTATVNAGGRIHRDQDEFLDLADHSHQVELYVQDTALKLWSDTVTVPVELSAGPRVGQHAYVSLPFFTDVRNGKPLRRHGRVTEVRLRSSGGVFYFEVVVECYPGN